VEQGTEALAAYHAEYAMLYQQREQRESAECSLRGQWSDLDCKTVEPMVLEAKGRDTKAIRKDKSLQYFQPRKTA
jgi:hypothetical protein